MNRTRRNALLATLLAVFFGVGAFMIIKPAFQNDSAEDPRAAEQDSPSSQFSDDPGAEPSASGKTHDGQSSPARSPVGKRPKVKSWRVAGATVTNKYPLANFNDVFTSGRSCAVLVNISETLPITVVSISVGPSGVFQRGEGCAAPDELGSTDLAGAVPCAAGVVLPPRQPSLRGCSVSVELLVTGRHRGAVTLVTRVVCTSRTDVPCTRLPSDLHPTADDPITLTIDDTIGFTGSDEAEPITKETPTPSPSPSSPETEPATETTDEPPTETPSPSA
ncbi:hypothetical protein [Nonomuraea wenchangensis]|uniref:hypothetical protein n=1 Tax=Nonomuraea wenchangensis TaxID=568860 RepID=UPI003792C827